MNSKQRFGRFKIGLAVSLVLLLAMAWFVLSINAKNRRSSEWVMRSAQMTLHLQEIYAAINAVEGYLLSYRATGDVSDLKHADARQQELMAQVQALRQFSSRMPAQAANARRLEALVRDRLGILRVDLYAGKNVVGSSEAEALRLQMLQQINRMKGQEERLLSERMAALGHSSDVSAQGVGVILILVSLLVVIASVIVFREYAEKFRIEQKLLEYQAELSDKVHRLNASNKELEQFAYVASHDLQEPLRKIITFSQVIMQKYMKAVSPEARIYLERMAASAARMQGLIEDLLLYSRVAKGPVQKQPVPLEGVLSIVKDNFEVLIQKRNVALIQHGLLPTVVADTTQMVQLFQNIIGNGIKFMPPGQQPVLEIFCSTVKKEELLKMIPDARYEEYYLIALKDNGIGFDERQLDKIFVTFQRLNGRSEYEGSGIGLSICKRIVEHHEGCITAKSEQGKGSVFFVYLPKDPQKHLNQTTRL